MTLSLVTTLHILRAIVGVILPVLALTARPAVAGNANRRERHGEEQPTKLGAAKQSPR